MRVINGQDSEKATLLSNSVRDVTQCGCVATAMSEGHRSLIMHHVEQGARSLGDLAGELGVSRRQLSRILSGDTPLRIEAIVAINRALGIDAQRALMAVGVLGDWQRYFDANLGVVLQLVRPVLNRLDETAEFVIEPLTPPAVARFAEWLGDAIIANEEQIRIRRDSFADLPEVRRPVRRTGSPTIGQ